MYELRISGLLFAWLSRQKEIFFEFFGKKVVCGIMLFLPTDQITRGSFFDLGRFRGTLFSKIFQKWEYLMRPCGLDLKKSTWTCTKVSGTQDNCPFWTHIFQNLLRSEVRCAAFGHSVWKVSSF